MTGVRSQHRHCAFRRGDWSRSNTVIGSDYDSKKPTKEPEPPPYGAERYRLISGDAVRARKNAARSVDSQVILRPLYWGSVSYLDGHLVMMRVALNPIPSNVPKTTTSAPSVKVSGTTAPI